MSNAKYRSVMHRARTNTAEGRYSFPNFILPIEDTVIEPFPELLSETNPPLYRSLTYGEYVNGFHFKSFAGTRHIDNFMIQNSTSKWSSFSTGPWNLQCFISMKSRQHDQLSKIYSSTLFSGRSWKLNVLVDNSVKSFFFLVFLLQVWGCKYHEVVVRILSFGFRAILQCNFTVSRSIISSSAINCCFKTGLIHKAK